jgi:hypothetical protein
MIKPSKLPLVAAGVAATMACSCPSALAQSADALIDKLVDKGILTVKEANDLREESDKNFNTAFSAKTGMSDWVTALKWNGDLRLRYDQISSDAPGAESRGRFRFRARFGLTATMFDDLDLGIRLASGNDDPISNNTTFENNGSKKEIRFDEVYMKWSPLHHGDWAGSVTAGKMANPLVFPSTILFDKDYTPEGAAQFISYQAGKDHTLSLLLTEFVLDETRFSNNDPFVLGAQVRWDAKWNERLASSVGAAGLTIVNPETLTTTAVPYIGQGNTRTAGGVLVNDYNVFYGDAGLTYTFDRAPFYPGPFPIYAYGNTVYNFGASDDNVGYGAGIRFGNAKKKGQWELNYLWTSMQADAWYDQFVESDFGATWTTAPAGGKTGYFSGTNIRGHWIKGTYNIFDQWSFSVAYFATELINPSPEGVDSSTSRLFVESVLKF